MTAGGKIKKEQDNDCSNATEAGLAAPVNEENHITTDHF